jgi:hypothetical protein
MLMAQDPRKQLNDSQTPLLSWVVGCFTPKENWRKIPLLWTLLLSSLRLEIMLRR